MTQNTGADTTKTAAQDGLIGAFTHGCESREADFALSLEGFEGPIDLLLFLVREQNFDLSTISISRLASQYLAFVNRVPEGQLQRAADYLVMASWLALLKSRLLLPREEQQELEEDPVQMAERLAQHLRQLQAMQRIAQQLEQRAQLGQDFFVAGHQQSLKRAKVTEYTADLPSLILAMRRWQEKLTHQRLRLRLSALPVMSIDEARGHLQRIVGSLPQWKPLQAILPHKTLSNTANMNAEDRQIFVRSSLASTLMASLEMQREGQLCLRQHDLQHDIEVKAVDENDGKQADE